MNVNVTKVTLLPKELPHYVIALEYADASYELHTWQFAPRLFAWAIRDQWSFTRSGCNGAYGQKYTGIEATLHDAIKTFEQTYTGV